MTKEYVCLKSKQTNLTVTNNKVSAVLRSTTTKTGIRLYDNNCIGISGAIGAFDDAELTSRAKRMLNFKLPYNAEPTSGSKRSLDLSGELTISDEDFVKTCGRILETLDKKYPKFMFSHKLRLFETESSIVNDLGTDLSQKDKYVELVLRIKYKESKNLIDGLGAYVARDMNFDEIVKALSSACESYEEKADFSTEFEKIPVVFLHDHYSFLMKFFTDLRGDVFAAGASLFSGKTNEKLFSDDFSLIVKRDAENIGNAFFDGEGVTMPNDKFALIDKGVLISPYTSKRMAKQYNLPITGCASMDYDAAPDASPMQLAIEESGKTIKELMGGRKGIFIATAAGGDFTPQGEYASPVQQAYFFDGEKFLGRLPQLSIASNVYDMFGKDFIGVSKDGDYPNSPFRYLVTEMNVRKIDDWM